MPPGGEGSLHQECCLLPCVGASASDICRAAGWANRTPSQDSTIFALSQFFQCIELAGVTLAAPFPPHRGTRRLFSPKFSSRTVNPGGILKHPGQSDWAEVDARPVLVLASRVSGQPLYWARCPLWPDSPSGNPICVFFHGKVPSW